jgi:flagellar biosynthesis protein FlhG
MLHDQADELRQLVRQNFKPAAAVGPAPRLIVVSGGKGGVGATTVAINLAVALTRLGNRTVWVDGDLNRGGAVDGWRGSQRGSLLDVLSGRRTIHEVLERGPAGVQVLPGAWAPNDLTEFSATSQFRFITDLKHLGLHADTVVVDLGSGRNHFVRRFWQVADLVLLVAAADAAAVMESYAAIKVLLAGEVGVPIHTLVNFADLVEAADVHERISSACRRFLGLRIASLGSLPESDEVAHAAASGQLHLWPATGGALAQRMEFLAEELSHRLRARSTEAGGGKRSAA